jgi:hypothetical protein
MQPIYSIGWEVKTKILNALKDDVAMSVTEVNEIICMDTPSIRKYLKAIVLDGFATETKVIHGKRRDSKINVYKAKNREQWEDYVLDTSGHDLRPPELRKPRAKKSIPHRDIPWWGLITNGCLEVTQ